MLGTEKFNLKLLVILLWICFGILVASFGEVKFSFTGTVIQLSSMAFEASRLTLLQLLLQKKGYKFNPMTAMFYLSPITALFLLVLFLIKEYSSVILVISDINPYFILANCCCAFILNIAVFLLIGKTSALTMNVSGVVKDWLIILSSALLFNSIVTQLNITGFTLAFTGVLAYNYIRRKMKEKEQQEKEQEVLEVDEECQPLQKAKS